MSADPTAPEQLSQLSPRSLYSHITEKQSRDPSQATLADRRAPIPVCMTGTDQLNAMSLLDDGWTRTGSYLLHPDLHLGTDRTAHATWYTRKSGFKIGNHGTLTTEHVTRVDVAKNTRMGEGDYDNCYWLQYQKYDKNDKLIDSFDTGVGYAGYPIGNPVITKTSNEIAYSLCPVKESVYYHPDLTAE